MSEEIINNENPVNETENNDQQQQQTQAGTNALGAGFSGGGSINLPVNPVTPITNPIVIQQPAFEKIDRAFRQRVQSFDTNARNSLGREVSQITAQIAEKEAEMKELTEEYNAQMVELTNEINALKQQAQSKSDIANTGELREEVLCDIYQTESEIIAVPVGADPAESSNVIARSQRVTQNEEVM